jgi:hypothetical protein
MSDNDTTRRRFLRVAGGTTVVALAGCSSTGDGSSGSDGADMDDGSMDNESMDDSEDMDDGSMDNESMDDGEDVEGDTDDDMMGTDPEEAPRASVDRFSEAAGTLHVRADNPDLPGADEPIDFDADFLTRGYGPDGGIVEYYDFDVQPTAPAPIYAFFHENGDPVEGQLNVVGTVPGEEGYNDFWRVNTVTVPDEYEPNTVTSVGALMDAEYDIETTDTVKNCPIVPDGSTASMRHGDADSGLVEGWYDGEVVSYFTFETLAGAGGSVPLSPIYVSFNTNPGMDGGGPPSGFMTEEGNDQTHNVVATLPGGSGYSPLWMVNIFDNADFDAVSDLSSATDAEILASGAANVNCPVVSVQ